MGHMVFGGVLNSKVLDKMAWKSDHVVYMVVSHVRFGYM